MPKYRSVGVEATLRVADLEQTMWKPNNQKERLSNPTERISGIFEENGKDLAETPANKSAMEYLGDYEDMPFFMVEAGELLQQGQSREFVQRDSITSPQQHMPTELSGGYAESSREATSLGMLGTSSQAAAFPPQPQKQPQALMLTVDLQRKSFLPEQFTKPDSAENIRGKHADKNLADLKIEVFLNGQLVGYDLYNPKQDPMPWDAGVKSLFFGTRFSRSTEKAWTYQSQDTLPSSANTMGTKERWTKIGELLRDEAKDRGLDKFGVPPPTADYLQALANLPIPERFVNTRGLGIMDVIITIGLGQKDNKSGCVTTPKRMESSKFSNPASALQTPAGGSNPSQTSNGMDRRTLEDALRNFPGDAAAASGFDIPEVSLNSTLSYAESHRHAAVRKHGQFNEEQFVVGMRFVVV